MDEEYYKLKYFKYKIKYNKLREETKQAGFENYGLPAPPIPLIPPVPPREYQETFELEQLYQDANKIMNMDNKNFMKSNPYKIANDLEEKNTKSHNKISSKVNQLVNSIRFRADDINNPNNPIRF